jgi:hypothetical protein
MANAGIAVDRTLALAGRSKSDVREELDELFAVEPDYRPTSVGLDQVTYARSYRPTWALVGGIILAPTIIGAALLLIRRTDSLSCRVVDGQTGVELQLHGVAPTKVVATIETLVAMSTTRAAMSASGAAGLGSNQHLASSSASPNHLPAGVVPAGVLPGGLLSAGVSSAVPVAPMPQAAVGLSSPPADSLLAGQPLAPASSPSLAGTSPWLIGAPPSDQPSVADNDGATRSLSSLRDAVAKSSPARPQCALVLEDGRKFDVSSFALLGRSPERRSDDPEAVLIDIRDDSVSKTHLSFGVDEDGAWVADRHSTNGSSILALNGTSRALVPGERVRVHEGESIRCGNCSVVVINRRAGE